MKRIALFLLFIAPLFAGALDGKRGPFDSFSFVQPASLPGVPGGPGVPLTVVWVQCSDPTISGVRLKLTYRDDSGEHQVSLLSDLVNGRGGFVTTVLPAKIVSAQFVELRETGSY
jgi:hypothetical protein